MNPKNPAQETGNKRIFLYALSTCVWCKKLKALLDSMGVKYDYVYVNELEGGEKEKTLEELNKINPSNSFPTLLVGDKCVVGYKEEQVKKLLGK